MEHLKANLYEVKSVEPVVNQRFSQWITINNSLNIWINNAKEADRLIKAIEACKRRIEESKDD